MRIRIDINGEEIHSILVRNMSEVPADFKGKCDYMVSVGKEWKGEEWICDVVHKRSDGALVLAQKAIEAIWK